MGQWLEAAHAQMARERALQMARADWQAGVISRDDVLTQARMYEAYLSGKPVLVTSSLYLSGPETEQST